jgi:hypothetical protein
VRARKPRRLAGLEEDIGVRLHANTPEDRLRPISWLAEPVTKYRPVEDFEDVLDDLIEREREREDGE